MDFAYHYTEEQLHFREEVTSWLATHVPPALRSVGDVQHVDAQFWSDTQALRRKLGAKGWLASTRGAGSGGGGLSQGHEVVLWEELQKLGILEHVSADIDPILRALERWGTESQSRDLIPAIARGEKVTWRMVGGYHGEPDTGNIGVHAFDDGDEYVLTGEAIFHGVGTAPDYLWAVASLDLAEGTHRRTACFLVPAGLAGVTVRDIRRLGSPLEHQASFENTRVPRYCLLGDAGDGWSVMDFAFGGDAPFVPVIFDDSAVDDLRGYADETTRDGVLLSEHPVYQQLLMEAYTIRHTVRLFRTRNAWLRGQGRALSYESAQVRLLERQAAVRLSEIVRETMGMYALLDAQDSRAPNQGRLEALLRKTLSQSDLGGTVAADRAEIASELGLGAAVEPVADSPVPEISAGARA